MGEQLAPITPSRAGELASELEGYDADLRLLDGLTAADSLAKVVRAPKHELAIVFDAQDYARRLKDEDAQDALFDIAV